MKRLVLFIGLSLLLGSCNFFVEMVDLEVDYQNTTIKLLDDDWKIEKIMIRGSCDSSDLQVIKNIEVDDLKYGRDEFDYSAANLIEYTITGDLRDTVGCSSIMMYVDVKNSRNQSRWFHIEYDPNKKIERYTCEGYM